MAERTRRYAKRPKAFAIIFGMVTMILVLSVAGLARLASAPI
jgi:hypothetical protein